MYDQVSDPGFSARFQDLEDRFHIAGEELPVKLVETVEVNSEEEIQKYHDKWVQEGFEGIIIRNKDGKYKVKHRSKDLQKYKEFKDEEFEIIGGHEGTGSDAGTVVFEVKTQSGKTFSVRPRGTKELRSAMLQDLKSLIGKELTVRYQELSEDGIPIFPVGIEVRDYE